MVRILLCGCFGKMGRVIQQLVAGRTDCTIAAGVDLFADSTAAFPAYTNIADVQEEADVIIDFSHPSLLTPILSYAAQKGGIPAVLCTTGYSAEQVEALKTAAQTQPVFYSRNMSLGINLLIELSKKAAKVLGDQFDIEIIEKHHNQKIDAPSGTALMLADAIASVRDGETQYVYDRHAQRKKREKSEIGLHAVRGGTIVGEHEVVFAGNHEVITLSHSAQSKELFATGAVNAAVYMCGKGPGLYDMSDMI
ncbi:MAG TPA: 4-hydroxy-tetrahydrodipicolinate reductase [Candidatus Ruminococcus gallistercoris]|nr:4-hydroxy-tetrahydrodipicolinate reductase [Candidatus Ruminococcus gallistercoris]